MPMQVFPVVSTPKGSPSYSDTWGAPRSGGRTHKGTDILADEGTPVVAVDDGAVKFGTDPLGGNVATLNAPDRTRYYYAHLNGFEGKARAVKAGDVIGYVGMTGNAAQTGINHLHFEVHPDGGDAVNPYPLLQEAAVVRWAPTLVQRVVSPAAASGIKYALIVVGGFAAGFLVMWLKGKKR
jgi:murein DD-endopeptidase MepM/ murein hydrolase activator NlpD